MNEWLNRSTNMQIVALSHPLKKGPILILDFKVYKDSFYISPNHLIASKHKISENLTNHGKIISLVKI